LFTPDFFQYLFFVRNLVSFSDTSDYFFPAWSLAVEEWFYVVFPLFLMLRIRRSPALMAGLFVAVLFAIKIALALTNPEALLHLRRIAALRLDSIAFGFLLYVLISTVSTADRRFVKVISAWGIILFGAIVAALSISMRESTAIWKDLAFTYAAPALGCSILALAYCYGDLGIRNRYASAVVLAAGRISYTVYLFHLPAILIVAGKTSLSAAPQFLIYIVSLVVFCLAFFRWVEAPLLASRPDYGKPERAHAMA
jgi:peptidoglycan/LPS O-acetylase OafA/YrhL